jgi:hypothetical protein
MILSAHQPSLIPWLGLLAKVAAADLFCIFDCVPDDGSGFANRQRIKTAQGAQWLTVPVRKSLDTPIKDVQIASDQPWARKTWRTIELAYQKAPYFATYSDGLKRAFLGTTWESLNDLDETMLFFFLNAFNIQTPVVAASDYSFQGAKSDLVLDMCRQLGASQYLFGSQGRDYADVASFEAAGITPLFQEYRHPVYQQLHGAFVEKLGALDLLFNVGGIEGRRLIVGGHSCSR